MTVTQIKNSIAVKLDGAYPGFPIYGEEIRQGFEAPCFFVRALSSSGTKEIGRRRRRSADFDIHYFPDPGAKQNDGLYAMGDALMEIFEHLEASRTLLKPANARYEIVDGVLHFFLSFDWFALSGADDPTLIADIDMEAEYG